MLYIVILICFQVCFRSFNDFKEHSKHCRLSNMRQNIYQNMSFWETSKITLLMFLFVSFCLQNFSKSDLALEMLQHGLNLLTCKTHRCIEHKTRFNEPSRGTPTQTNKQTSCDERISRLGCIQLGPPWQPREVSIFVLSLGDVNLDI